MLSIVLIAYNMKRELDRTVKSLSPDVQLDIEGLNYEVIVVDNGSQAPLDSLKLKTLNRCLRIIEVADPKPSPVGAIQLGLDAAVGEHIGLFIDAARMASPRLIYWALIALRIRSNAVVGALSFHIGRQPQNLSVLSGYNQSIEDELLQSVDWEKNPYSLFNIASFDPSSWQGYFACPAETNSIFMARKTWRECGGYDRRFESPGGGIVNLDIWKRLCEDRRFCVFVILGEGTFHQIHGGITTNAVKDKWRLFEGEYLKLKGERYKPPKAQPQVIGHIGPECALFLMRSGFRISRSRTFSFRILSRARRLISISLFSIKNAISMML